MQIRLGGVPEHFNLPIRLAIENGVFSEAGFDVVWQYFPGGTGAMTKALADGGLDMAILLTEGFIAAKNKGLQAKIVKSYIDSPLVWGIYTGSSSPLHSIYNKIEKKYAISRFGSGSHLMALIHAQQRGEQILENNFVVVNDLKTAAHSLYDNESQIFYWEKYTSKEYVENGQMRLIGEFAAPWSGFLMVANEDFIEKNNSELQRFLQIINEITISIPHSELFAEKLIAEFNLTKDEVAHWLRTTVWNHDFLINEKGIQNAIHALQLVSDFAIANNTADYCSHFVKLIK